MKIVKNRSIPSQLTPQVYHCYGDVVVVVTAFSLRHLSQLLNAPPGHLPASLEHALQSIRDIRTFLPLLIAGLVQIDFSTVHQGPHHLVGRQHVPEPIGSQDNVPVG